jgi:hypothetical protein
MSRALCFAIIHLIAATCLWAQMSLVRVTECGPGAYPATVCPIPATAAGNLIVVGWASAARTAPTITSVTDNAGNVYSEAGAARAVDSGAGIVDIWYARNSKSGATQVTITPSPSGNNGAAVIWQFAGADAASPLLSTGTLNEQAATTTPVGAPIAASSGELIVTIMTPTGTPTGLVAGSPFVNDSLLYGVGWAHAITGSAGTYTARWNAASGTFASTSVSFRAASGGSPCDLSQDGTTNVIDVQLITNMHLGARQCTANIAGPGVCTAEVVDRVVSAALGNTCVVTGGSGTSHSVSLSWTASSSSGVVGYNVYRATVSGGPFTKVNSALIQGTTYTDNSVVGGQTYYYAATAVNGSSLESSYSNQVSTTIPAP